MRGRYKNLTLAVLQLCDQTHLVVSADVQQHRETLLRPNTSTGCVERQLPNRNTHSVASQVTQAEDTLPVCHHNGLHKNTY